MILASAFTGAFMPLLFLYRLIAALLAPVAKPFLLWRAKGGREDLMRLDERLGRASAVRPAGRVIWLHAASVGEGLSLLPLIDRIVRESLEVLVTTGTTSAALVLRGRLPAGAAHQYAPLDAPQFVSSFLEHWRPELALFAESEIWPNMLIEMSRRKIPLVLVNARISQDSVLRWRRASSFAAELFGLVELCLAQDNENAERFKSLGVRNARVVGNLKFDSPAPPVDPIDLAALQGAIGARPVLAAVSTHPGEEALVLDAHVVLSRLMPELLTIIAPRHPERGEGAMGLAGERRLRAMQRTSAKIPPSGDIQVYIADTLGELGLVFRTAGVVFMGRSLYSGGGHNPIEPARFGCAILHGPSVGDFGEIYSALDAAKGALVVEDARSLANAAQAILVRPARMRKMGRAANDVVTQFGGATRETMAALAPYLARADEPR